MMPVYIVAILTLLIIIIVVGIVYGIKSDLEDAELYKAEVDNSD